MTKHTITVESRDDHTIDVHCVDPCQRLIWASNYLDPSLEDIQRAATRHRREFARRAAEPGHRVARDGPVSDYCMHRMFSGLSCELPAGHEGRHADRFGLHDPLGWRDDD